MGLLLYFYILSLLVALGILFAVNKSNRQKSSESK